MTKPTYIYVDVDETLVRSHGTKRIPMPNIISHIRELKSQGAIMYLWSSGGADYARESAIEFDIEDCFVGFLPKPNVLIDDMSPSSWTNLLEIHPNECDGNSVSSYREKLDEHNAKK